MALGAIALVGVMGGQAIGTSPAVIAELRENPTELADLTLPELGAPLVAPPAAATAPMIKAAVPRPRASSAIGAVQLGEATYFANMLDGRPTASGEPLDQQELVAAHRDYPFGTWLKVTDQASGKSVVVRVIDRGPFAVPGKNTAVIDLSRAAAQQIGLLQRGRAKVKIEVIPAPVGTAERGEGGPGS
jgi:rare lipoprotein A